MEFQWQGQQVFTFLSKQVCYKSHLLENMSKAVTLFLYCILQRVWEGGGEKLVSKCPVFLVVFISLLLLLSPIERLPSSKTPTKNSPGAQHNFASKQEKSCFLSS